MRSVMVMEGMPGAKVSAYRSTHVIVTCRVCQPPVHFSSVTDAQKGTAPAAKYHWHQHTVCTCMQAMPQLAKQCRSIQPLYAGVRQNCMVSSHPLSFHPISRLLHGPCKKGQHAHWTWGWQEQYKLTRPPQAPLMLRCCGLMLGGSTYPDTGAPLVYLCKGTTIV